MCSTVRKCQRNGPRSWFCQLGRWRRRTPPRQPKRTCGLRFRHLCGTAPFIVTDACSSLRVHSNLLRRPRLFLWRACFLSSSYNRLAQNEIIQFIWRACVHVTGEQCVSEFGQKMRVQNPLAGIPQTVSAFSISLSLKSLNFVDSL